VTCESGVQNDTDQNGYLEMSELKVALRTLPSCEALSETDLDAFTAFCDILGNGRLNYLEFLADFHIEPSSKLAEQISEDVLESFFRVLYFDYRPLVTQV